MNEMFAKLAAPFRPDAVHWRAQNVSSKGDSALALAFLDARDVMARLDEAVGPDNWQDAYVETAKGRLICTLTIRCAGEWIAKSDGAGETDIEGEKGALSDALKRAAVKWGIGRYLYDMPAIWCECECYPEKNAKGKWVWKAWTERGRAKMLATSRNAPAPRTSEPDGGAAALLAKIETCDTELALRRVWEGAQEYVKASPEKAQLERAKDARKLAINAMNQIAA